MIAEAIRLRQTPEKNFGYSYFSHMIPPMKPEHTLMLGYGLGIIPELMRKVWGPSKITAVDQNGYVTDDAYFEHEMIKMDAYDYVKECTDSLLKKRFDYITIDLWDGFKVPTFVYQTEFVVRLREMATDKVCINQPSDEFEKLRQYFDYGFKFDRSVVVIGNRVSWWSIQGGS